MTMPLCHLRSILHLLLLAVLLMHQAPVFASTPSPLSADDLNEYLDSTVPGLMTQHHVPGLVISVVQDGKIIAAKGYGYANLETETLAHPEASMFRIASVSKLFVAVAVLQLVEQGRLDLDADVNSYLAGSPVEVRNSFPQSLTVRHLLLHTDGFEERNTRIFALHAEHLRPLEQVLASDLQPLALPPGKRVSYGSFGSALASYLVEVVSGQPFEEYVEANILQPLKMQRTTLRQILPTEQMASVATVYQYEDGVYLPSPYLYMTTPATGGASSSAADMARLLLALLNQGELNGERVLQASSVESMFKRGFSPHPGLPGITHGFFEHVENGRRGLLREGSGLGVNSRVFLLPEEGFGLFIAVNTRGDVLNVALTSALLDRYFPKTADALPLESMTTEDVQQFAGNYRYVQYSRRTITKISMLLASQLVVKASNHGTLIVAPILMGDPYGGFEETAEYVQVEPMLFQAIDGNGWLAFEQDAQGRITHLNSGNHYHGAFERIAWNESPTLHLVIVLGFALAFLVMVVFAIRQRALLIGLASFTSMIYLIGVIPVFFMVGATAGFPAIAYVEPLPILTQVFIYLPLLISVLALAILVSLVRAFRAQPAAQAQAYLFSGGVLVSFLLYLADWNLVLPI